MKISLLNYDIQHYNRENRLLIGVADAPLILGMILESEYGRYGTVDSVGFIGKGKGLPFEMWQKWQKIFSEISTNPDFSRGERLMISHFVRYTFPTFASRSFNYDCTPSQLQQIVCQMEQFLREADKVYLGMPADFSLELCRVFEDFINQVSPFLKPLPSSTKPDRNIPLFAKRQRTDEWGENYCANYQASLQYLSKMITFSPMIDYEFSFGRKSRVFASDIAFPAVFTPDSKYGIEWARDMNLMIEAGLYPMCIKVNVCERGTLDEFIAKCNRLCLADHALVGREVGVGLKNEVHTQTISTLEKYLNETQYVGSAEMVAISNELNKIY